MAANTPPQYAAMQQQPSGITDDWAFRRAMGTLPPENDIVAGLMGYVNRAPGSGQSSTPTYPAASSSAQQVGQAANTQASFGASPEPVSSSAQDSTGASIPNAYAFDYSGHQPGPWPSSVPARASQCARGYHPVGDGASVCRAHLW